MIAVDTNILVYAHRADSPWHERGANTMRKLAEGSTPWGLPWPCVHEFLAIVTHPRIYKPPTPLDRAIEQVDAWLSSPTVALLAEGGDHWAVLRDLLRLGKIVGPKVHDARVAAVCAQHGVNTLWSADRDLSSIGGIRTLNPLLQAP